jgi:general secretion pathway protein E
MNREGLLLRAGLVRQEFVPFDEVRELENGGVRLRSGAYRKLAAAQRPEAVRALDPPAPTGDRARDAERFLAYSAGSWSPERAAEALVAMASSLGATDLHLESVPEGWAVRIRIDGELSAWMALPPATGARLVAALKFRSSCLPYRSDVPQEGRISRAGVAADIRASFLPTALGERAALRLFGRLLALGELGLDETLRGRFEALLDARDGLIVVAGPSGAGKTTTIYAALAHLASRRAQAHLSLEDPVEQRLRVAGIPVDQVELCPERGLTAEAALAAALRQDVDVLAVGEVRTAAEAGLAVRAAHTGRLVLAGLHAGSASEAVRRLEDLGCDPTVLAVTLRGVLHQRLAAGVRPRRVVASLREGP